MENLNENEQKWQEMFRCLDCSVNTNKIREYYMVEFKLWYSVAGKGMLCVGCLEERLGRFLTPEDFIEAPINYGIFGSSERLQDRLGDRFTKSPNWVSNDKASIR